MTSRDPAVPARRDPSAAAPGPRLRLVGGGDEPAAAAAGRSAGEKTQELFERHHRRLVGFLRRLTSAEQAEEIVEMLGKSRTEATKTPEEPTGEKSSGNAESSSPEAPSSPSTDSETSEPDTSSNA